MIVRISEALVLPEALERFMAELDAVVADFPERFDGLDAHEIVADLDDRCRVLYISRWRDEEALVRFAGPHWRTDPVVFPGEAELLRQPLRVRHFSSPRPST